MIALSTHSLPLCKYASRVQQLLCRRVRQTSWSKNKPKDGTEQLVSDLTASVYLLFLWKEKLQSERKFSSESERGCVLRQRNTRAVLKTFASSTSDRWLEITTAVQRSHAICVGPGTQSSRALVLKLGKVVHYSLWKTQAGWRIAPRLYRVQWGHLVPFLHLLLLSISTLSRSRHKDRVQLHIQPISPRNQESIKLCSDLCK